MTESTSTPVPPPKGKDLVQDGATASLTPSSPSKEKGEPPVDLTYRDADPCNPPTSTPIGFLEGFDLSNLDENTLTSDFQVGRHVSPQLFFGFFSRVRDQHSRWE